MITPTILILTFFIFSTVHSCNRKSDDEIKRITYENPSGYYTVFGEVNRACLEMKQDTQRYKLKVTTQTGSCTNLPPGLLAMQHGYAQDFLASPQTLYDRRIVTKKKLLETISGDVSMDRNSNGYTYFLPLVRLNFTDGITSAAYLKVQIEGFEVALHSLKPSTEMYSQYQKLPSYFKENPLAYYHFINSYGTGIITSTTFGGRFQVLVTSDGLKNELLNTDMTDKASIEGVLNQVINTDAESSRVTMLVEGGGFPASTSRKDIAQWQQFVMDSPVSLFPNLLSIPKFLEPSVISEKTKALEQAVQFEKEAQNIRKVLYGLDIVKRGTLSDFLKRLLEEEYKRVCPSEKVSSIVKHGILGYSNVDLSKFFIKCIHKREYSEYHQQDVIRTHYFKLIPGLCFTITEKLEPCLSTGMMAPTGLNCVLFFKENRCQGSVTRIVKTSSEMKDAFNLGLTSFAFCE